MRTRDPLGALAWRLDRAIRWGRGWGVVVVGASRLPAGAGGARASVVMAAGTMVSRVLGVVRTALLVSCVGTAAASNAFNTANTLPNNVYALLSGGLLNAILIPQITKAMLRSDEGKAVVDRLVTLCVAVILGVTVVATVLAWPLCYVFGLRGPTLGLGVMFAYLCLPQIFFYGLYAVLGQVLNARGSFAAFMWTPVLANLVQIGAMVVFLSRFAHPAPVGAWSATMVWWLAGTTTLGIVVQAVGLVPALWRTGFRWYPRGGFRGYGLRAVSAMAGWAFAALVLSQLGGLACTAVMNLVTQKAANTHQMVAGVTIYQIAFMFFMLPQSVITTSILTALYPQMARAASLDDTSGLRDRLRQGLTSPSVFLVPITIAGIVLAEPGIGLLQPSLRGPALRDTALVFALMIVGLVPFGWTTLQQRFLFAVGDGRTNLILQGLLVLIQVAFAALAWIAPPHRAVAVIAIGQTLGNLVAALTFVIVAQHRLGHLPLRQVLRLHVHLGLISILAGATAWITITATRPLIRAPEYLTHATQLAIGVSTFAAVFLLSAYLTHLTEITQPLTRLTTRTTKPRP